MDTPDRPAAGHPLIDALAQPADRALARARAERLVIAVRRWPAPVRQELPEPLCRTVCGTVAAIAPHLPDGPATALVHYALWTVLLDDRLDAPEATLPGLRRLEAQVHGVLAGGLGTDPLTRTLADILAELDTPAGDPVLRAEFRDALADAVRAGVLDAQRRRSRPHWRPDLAEHLTLGGSTVNYRSFALAVLLAGGARVPGELAVVLDRALTPAAQAVRLANDLRAPGRDEREGRPPVHTLPGPAGTPLSRTALRRRITTLTHRHDRLLSGSPALVDSGVAAQLSACLHAAVGLYGVADLERGAPGARTPTRTGVPPAAPAAARPPRGARRGRPAVPG